MTRNNRSDWERGDWRRKRRRGRKEMKWSKARDERMGEQWGRWW